MKTCLVAKYVSPNNPNSCVDVAIMYSDAHGENSALCGAQFLRMEMEHYTTGEWLGTASKTERELLKAAAEAELMGAEYILVCRE